MSDCTDDFCLFPVFFFPGGGNGAPLQYSGLGSPHGSQRVLHNGATFTFTVFSVLRPLGPWSWSRRPPGLRPSPDGWVQSPHPSWPLHLRARGASICPPITPRLALDNQGLPRCSGLPGSLKPPSPEFPPWSCAAHHSFLPTPATVLGHAFFTSAS